MDNELTIALCQNYHKELQYIINTENITDIQIQILTADCKNCICNNHEKPGSAAYFLTANEESDRNQAFRLCQTQLISPSLLYQYMKNGYYIIIPGWLQQWEKQIKEIWGFDSKNWKKFLKESIKKILLLETGIYENSLEELKAFSIFSGLDYEVLEVGLDYFQKNILNVYKDIKIGILALQRHFLENKMINIICQAIFHYFSFFCIWFYQIGVNFFKLGYSKI